MINFCARFRRNSVKYKVLDMATQTELFPVAAFDHERRGPKNSIKSSNPPVMYHVKTDQDVGLIQVIF